MNDNIKRLQAQIEAEENRIRNCKHDFDKSFYNAEKIQVQDARLGYERHGVDSWPILSFHTETKDRWTRKCKLCGFEQHTYNQKPIVTGYEPSF